MGTGFIFKTGCLHPAGMREPRATLWKGEWTDPRVICVLCGFRVAEARLEADPRGGTRIVPLPTMAPAKA